jgi:hypothetical protein
MKPFPVAGPVRLEWTQPRAFDRYFELRAGDELVGTLQWEGMLSSLATARTAHGGWTLEQPGILNQRVEVRELHSDSLVATFTPKLMGNGILAFDDGHELEWEPTNFWATNWSFFDGADQPSVSLQEGVEGARWRDMFKTQFTVTVDGEEWTSPHQVLLAALGLYLIILRQQAAAGATAASTAVI